MQSFEASRPMTYQGRSFEVWIQAGINLVSGELTALFMSIDPATGLPPEVFAGFLPPEDGTGRGQGHVSFLVRAQSALPDATRFRNVALISFDGKPAIATNQRDPHDPTLGVDPAKECLLTLDTSPPASAVNPLAPTVGSANFLVSWSGTDIGSGIAGYHVFVSANNGPWELWQAKVPFGSALYPGEVGSRYAFFSVAEDNVGNLEPAPSAADAETTVTLDSRPFLQIHFISAGASLSISWQSVIGNLYSVQVAENVMGDWSDLEEFADRPGTGQTMTFTTPISAVGQFFRVRVQPSGP
jgi:hypothetical protein